MPPALKLFLSSTQTGQPKVSSTVSLVFHSSSSRPAQQVQSPELDQQELTERGKPTPTTCVGSTPITSARMTRRRSNVCGDRTREDTSSSEDAPRPATRRKTISFEETPTKRPRLRIVSNELDEAIAAAEQLIAFGRDVRDLGEVGWQKWQMWRRRAWERKKKIGQTRWWRGALSTIIRIRSQLCGVCLRSGTLLWQPRRHRHRGLQRVRWYLAHSILIKP
ncbi:hypothetical protein BCR39DRAFT_232351 [Naematelia encephala]|uniref:Uncharacterized protein n=1 Tax=Naematelia encephala TaxID=71784 RepID=A0A1Y2BGR3_9TREE|nr:hypothetical protein BCR39DRAFT_232351 [Naematelia encephala]